MNFINMNSKKVRKIKSVRFLEETSRSKVYEASSIVKNEILIIEVANKAKELETGDLVF